MQAFIEKEAQEKAREIRVKADEEYEIEKALAVRAETAAIDADYTQKLKKASLAQQIIKSTIGNKTRLRVLDTKDKVLGEILDESEKSLLNLTKDEQKYQPILAGLIEEGLLALLEKSVFIQVREVDLEVAKRSLNQALENFKAKAGYSPKCDIDKTTFLSKNIAGGVVVISGSGKVEVKNTLEERLQILSQEALPGVRLELFGSSATRKFFN